MSNVRADRLPDRADQPTSTRLYGACRLQQPPAPGDALAASADPLLQHEQRSPAKSNAPTA